MTRIVDLWIGEERERGGWFATRRIVLEASVRVGGCMDGWLLNSIESGDSTSLYFCDRRRRRRECGLEVLQVERASGDNNARAGVLFVF